MKPVKSWDNLAYKYHNGNGSYLDNTVAAAAGKSYSSKNVSHVEQRDSKYFASNKSTESLFYSQNLSETAYSCEYLNQTSPTFISNEEGRFVPLMPSDFTNQRDKASQTDSAKKLVDIPQTPEITRL